MPPTAFEAKEAPRSGHAILQPDSKATGEAPHGRFIVPLILAGATMLVHLLFNSGYGFFRDELYYIACGEYLAFGYVDHPPLIALIAKISRVLLGESLFAFRFLPAVASAAVVFFSALTASELGGKRFAQALTGLCVLSGGIFIGTGNILSTIVFDQLCWILALYLIVRLLNTGNSRLFIGLGIAIGIGLMAKHTMVYLAIGVAVSVVITPARKYLRDKNLWIGVILATALFLPNIIWQIINGWPTIAFLKGLQSSVVAHQTLGGLFVDFVSGVNPFTFPIALTGLWFLFGMERGKPYRLAGIIILTVTAILVVQGTKSYYLAPLYPLLLAGGAIVIERNGIARHPTLVPATIMGLVVVTGIALAPLALPILPIEKLLRYTEFFGMTENYNWTGKSQRLPTHFADQLGWPELVDDVAGVFNSLPPEDRPKTAIYARNFGEAGAIDLFGKSRGLPPSISGNHSYFLWGPRQYTGEIIITVGEKIEDLRQTFEEVELKAIHRHPYAMSLEQEVPIAVCRRMKAPLQSIWPKVRSGF